MGVGQGGRDAAWAAEGFFAGALLEATAGLLFGGIGCGGGAGRGRGARKRFGDSEGLFQFFPPKRARIHFGVQIRQVTHG